MDHAEGDNDLLRRTARGDAAAARALWARHAPRLLATAALLVRGREASAGAHDVVQQVFVRVAGLSGAEARAVRDAGAFLTTLTRRLALNARRAESREQERRLRLVRDGLGEGAGGGASEGSDPARGVPADLRAALDALDPDERELIVLRHVAGLSFDQMALALDVNRSTLASRYRAALERLRRATDETPETRHAEVTRATP